VGSTTIEEGQWRLRKAASLVKLLALAPGHRLHREQAMDILWPDSGRRAASNSLRKTLHAARRTLDPDAGSRYLASKNESLTLCPGGGLWIDVETFEEAARATRRARDPAAYRAAIDLYVGELLPEDRYEEWAEEPRRHLRETYLSLLLGLTRLYEERGDHESAVEALRRGVAEEPAREEAHVGLMRLYAHLGRKGEALAQYERLEEVLLRELSTEPSASSRALREEIAAGRYPPKEAPSLTHLPEQALGTGKHNLPAARTSFVGREREMLEVKRALVMTRLLTLTGAGGSGKTRLALEVARDLVGSYPDGVWLVELAPLTEGELVPHAVTRASGVREHPGHPLTDTLTEALREKEALLVLDNCEHLADSVARLLDTLLDSCPRLRVLATSRETLGVKGEAIRRVSSLSVPDTDRLPAAGELTRYDAVRLFLDRAQLRVPNFNLTSENASAVAEVCRKLEGIPLAIELATARVGTLSMRQISERLRDPLDLLSAGGRTAVPRQQTLRGTLDWSYKLLSESERVLFRRLSVFAGGWPLEAAEAVASGDGIEKGDILNLLSRLVDRSLVAPEVPRDSVMRYKMLEPVRQYAQEKLKESGEADAVSQQHTEFFLALAEQAEPTLQGARQGEWLERLELEHSNFRAALQRSLDTEESEPQGRAELGLRLAVALAEGRFWTAYGLREGRGWLERGLAKSSSASPMAMRAKALNEAGWIALFQGHYQKTVILFEEALALSREQGDKAGAAISLAYLGMAAVQVGDIERAMSLREEASTLMAELVDRRAIAHLLLFLGWAALHERDLEQAAELLEEGLALNRELGDMRGTAVCLSTLGMIMLIQGDLERAATRFEEDMRVLRSLRDKQGTAYCLLGLAAVAAVQGRPVRAARLWGAAEALREAIGLPLSPFDRANYDYEGYQVVARTGLGNEATWTEAWAEGRAMTLKEATQYALTTEEHPLPAASTPEQRRTGKQPITLTHREEEVAALIARGLTNRQIAAELSISEHTAATHVARILKKLGLNSRSQLAAWVTEQGLFYSDSG
jgi:predicted ATPase/DNA-binding SARP family transcriptional activator/DNA-binding CsgD family transcriptional regulator